jgi:hypothetical protein
MIKDKALKLVNELIAENKALKAALAQPAQEPVSVTYKEVADAMNSLWNGTLEQHQIAEQMANKKLYTTPQQRPWVGLTDEEVSTLWGEWKDAVCLDYKTWAQAYEAYLKEKNNG